MSVGRMNQPVSAKALNCLFHKVKDVLDEAIQLENGCITHFEVSNCASSLSDTSL